MENYSLFLTMAAATILSPGPGVTLTLTNSIRYGLFEASGGIIGIAVGALAVATIAATGVGLVLTTSPLAFDIMKYVGAAYLVYLGVKMWRSPSHAPKEGVLRKPSWRMRFVEGLSLQFSNPKAIFFFVSVFPQFINSSHPYVVQFLVLVLTYGLLVVMIHFLYAMTANKTRNWLSSPRGSRVVARIGGSAFIFFGLALANSHM